MSFSFKVISVFFTAFILWSCVDNKKTDLSPKTCLTPVDSAVVSFSQDIFPIIQSECISCHNSTNANAGYIFETYQNIADKATDIHSAITTSNGFQTMPQSGPMNDCKIEKISTWIKNGKPNN